MKKLWLIPAVVLLAGCTMMRNGQEAVVKLKDNALWRHVVSSTNQTQAATNVWAAVVTTTKTNVTTTVVTNGLAGITLLDADVSAWPVTANLTGVRVRSDGGRIWFDYDTKPAWPKAGDGLMGNAWIVVKWTDGKTYAATWEWLKPSQTMKNMKGKSWASHINKSPLNKFEPKSGETYGFFCSTHARSATRTLNQRTNPQYVVWP